MGLGVADRSSRTLEGGAKFRDGALDALMAVLKFRDALGDCVGVVRRGPSSEMALK